MRLFPWPQNDGAATPARRDMWWKRSSTSARGLLIDSPAVPLQFEPETTRAENAAPAQAAPPKRTRGVVENLFVVRSLKPR